MEELERSRSFSPSDAPYLSWGTYCDLLDERPWEASGAGNVNGGETFIAEHVDLLREEFQKPGQYFFPVLSPRHACEVLWLKLSLFESLCRQIARRQDDTRRPVFQIDERHVLIEFAPDAGAYVPIRWRGVLRLPHSAEPLRTELEGMPAEMAQTLGAVPNHVDQAYLSPMIREWPHGREVRATALIQSLDPIPEEEEEKSIRGLLRIHLIADSILAKDFSGQDVFCIMLPLGAGRHTVRLWARKIDTPERGIVLSGVTDGLSPEVWEMLERDKRQSMSNARAIIYRSFSPSCDLYSLGTLLLRTLLGSDSQRWNRMLGVLPDMVDGIAPAVQGIEASDHYTMHVRVRDYLSEQGDLFVNTEIASDIWWDTVRLAFQAMTRIRGFSYGCPSVEHPTAQEGASVMEFGNDIGAVAYRAKVELFEQSERDAAVRAACESAMVTFGTA